VPITVLLADDHEIVREGVRSILERQGFSVVGEASDGREAVALASALRPDVAVLDAAMPLLNGIDAARAITALGRGTKSVLLTMHTEAPRVRQALRAGVRGYVVKTQASSDLTRAIHDVVRGYLHLSPIVSSAAIAPRLRPSGGAGAPLTLREREVVQLIAEGKTTKEIASILHLSPKTVDSHRMRSMAKLDVHNISSLVRYAIREGMIDA
jgi:two-component system, NarL family, response regulator NreC